MRNWFTLLWFSAIFSIISMCMLVASFVFEIYLLNSFFIILLYVGLFLGCYVMLFGLIFPLLWDLYKAAVKLDKEVK